MCIRDRIPAAWKGKRIFLYFERTHWLSSVYVGKEEVSKIDYILSLIHIQMCIRDR